MADRATEANDYMKKRMFFVPRMFQVLNTVAPETGERFADFYASVWPDGALPRKVKELMFTAIDVSYCSPRCIIHVIPAIEAGATDGEIFEAVTVGTLGWRLRPRRAGHPLCHRSQVKVVLHPSR